MRLFVFFASIGALILFLSVTCNLYPSISKNIRVAIFEAVSTLTTTGFSTAGYREWNGAGILLLVTFMLIGGGICSTAGGIKQYRVYLLMKSVVWEVERVFLPRTAVIRREIWRGENHEFVDDSHIREIAAFVVLYMILYTVGTLVIAMNGYSLRDSMFEFASSVGTVGLSIGVTAAGAPKPVLWTEILGMFMGRLEFFVVFVTIGKIVNDMRGR
jgi:trk system potassium uptake protein TrkH